MHSDSIRQRTLSTECAKRASLTVAYLIYSGEDINEGLDPTRERDGDEER